MADTPLSLLDPIDSVNDATLFYGVKSSTDYKVTALQIVTYLGTTIPTLVGDNAFTGANTFTNAAGITTRQAATNDAMILNGRAGGTSSYAVTLTPTTLTDNRTATFPDASIVVSGSASALTASRIVASTTGGLLQALDTGTYPSLTELSYVKGLSSAIQTQLGTKVGTAANLTNVGRMVRVSAAGVIGETDISVGAADGIISRAGAITLTPSTAVSVTEAATISRLSSGSYGGYITIASTVAAEYGSLIMQRADTYLRISGSSGATTGANVQLYGASHATLAGVGVLYSATTEALRWNASGQVLVNAVAPIGSEKMYCNGDFQLASAGVIKAATSLGITSPSINVTGAFGVRGLTAGWATSMGVTQVGFSSSVSGRTSGSGLHLCDNIVFTGDPSVSWANAKYISSTLTSAIRLQSGTIVFAYSAAGTAGDPVTVLEAMRISTSGQLLVNATASIGSEKIYCNGDFQLASAGVIKAATSITTTASTLSTYHTATGFGIGAAPSYLLHVTSASSGASASADADEVVVQGGSGGCGISLLAPDADSSRIYFGAPSDGRAAKIQHSYTGSYLKIATDAVGHNLILASGDDVEAVRINSSAQLLVNAAAPIGSEKLYVNGATVFGDMSISATGAITRTGDITINTVRVGLGGGAVGTNVCVGGGALAATATGNGNTAVGYTAGPANLAGGYNNYFGYRAGYVNAATSYNVFCGAFSGSNHTTGDNNFFLGYLAGSTHADGSTPLTTSSQSIYIGSLCRGKDNSDSNSIVIGYSAIGKGANTAVWGNTSITHHYFSGSAIVNAAAPIGSEKLYVNGDFYTSGKATLAAKAGSTTAGDLWHDSTRVALQTYTNGIEGTLSRVLCVAYADVTHSGVVTDQSLLSATKIGSNTLPADFFLAGKAVRLKLGGHYTTDASPGTVELEVTFAGSTIRTTGAVAPGSNKTDAEWNLDLLIICQSAGASGTLQTRGVAIFSDNIGSMSTVAAAPWTTVDPVTVDTTAQSALDAIITISDAGTEIVCTSFTIEELN